VAVRTDSNSRPGVTLAAVVGVVILLVGPVIGPFTSYDFGLAATNVDQSYVEEDSTHMSIARDSWSLTSGFFVSGSTDVKAAQEYARKRLVAKGLGDNEFQCLVDLWDRESKWNVSAANGDSGAFGIPQALPGKKMSVFGDDWKTNFATQIKWGLSYIKGRYETPCKAWSHSEQTGWY
jgi:hypothetical protein